MSIYLLRNTLLVVFKSVFFKSHQNASLEPIIPNYPLDMNIIFLSNKAQRENKSECVSNVKGMASSHFPLVVKRSFLWSI